MKFFKVTTVVLTLHVLLVGVLVLQPGCKVLETKEKKEGESGTMGSGSVVAQGSILEEKKEGIPPVSGRYEPTRPRGEWAEEDKGILSPVKGSEGGVKYTVKAGDSLWLVAKRHGVSLDHLLQANGLNRNSVIKVGQHLEIPGGKEVGGKHEVMAHGGVKGHMASGETYKVKSGDSLSKIAARHGVRVSALKEVNHLTSDVIIPGRTLMIPVGGHVAGGGNKEAASGQIKREHGSKALEADGTYKVKQGDYLGSIAKRFGVKTADLMEWNHISDARKLRVGQHLVVKGSSVEAGRVESSAGVQHEAGEVKAAEHGSVSEASANNEASVVGHEGEGVKVEQAAHDGVSVPGHAEGNVSGAISESAVGAEDSLFDDSGEAAVVDVQN